MFQYRISLQKKVTLFTTLIVAFTLILSGFGFLAIQIHQFRKQAGEELSTIADIIAAISQAALEFQDEKVAAETLQALRPDQRIIAGCIYTGRGKKLAEFHREYKKAGEVPDTPLSDGLYITGADIRIFKPVTLNERRIGTVYLEGDISFLILAQMKRSILTALCVLAGSLAAGFLLSRWLQRLVTRPILSLAGTVRKVSEQKDYSLRASKEVDDEVGYLVTQFNDLLRQIQQRDESLKLEIEERRLAEQRFSLAVESSPTAMIMVDTQGIVTLINAEAERMFGYQRDEILGKDIECLIPARFRNTHRAYRRAFAGEPKKVFVGGAGRDLFGLRKDGSEFPAEIGLSPIQNQNESFVLSAVVDITERRSAEQYQSLLLAELSHRVKNTLATVRSLASHTAQNSSSTEEFLISFEGRILALARTHSLLTESNWRGTSLRGLSQQAVKPYLNEETVNVIVSGPEVNLPPKASVSMSMILHELCTNAAKYGAFSVPDGKVSIQWEQLRDRQPGNIRLIWQESGGPDVQQPVRKGFGTTLVELAAEYELQGQGRLHFFREGLRYEIIFPLDGTISDHVPSL
jgi:PAS domain S-box-containing protein